MVNVVGLEHRPEQLLHLVGVFVDTPGTGDTGHGIGTGFGNDGFQPVGGVVQGPFPGDGLSSPSSRIMGEVSRWSE